MTHVTCMLTAKNQDQLRNHTLGNRVWATLTFSNRSSSVIVQSNLRTGHIAGADFSRGKFNVTSAGHERFSRRSIRCVLCNIESQCFLQTGIPSPKWALFVRCGLTFHTWFIGTTRACRKWRLDRFSLFGRAYCIAKTQTLLMQYICSVLKFKSTGVLMA